MLPASGLEALLPVLVISVVHRHPPEHGWVGEQILPLQQSDGRMLVQLVALPAQLDAELVLAELVEAAAVLAVVLGAPAHASAEQVAQNGRPREHPRVTATRDHPIQFVPLPMGSKN